MEQAHDSTRRAAAPGRVTHDRRDPRRPAGARLAAVLLALLLAAPFAAAQEPDWDQLPDDRVLYIAPGQSLSKLVQRVYPDRPGDWDAIRAWIVENNRHAFVGADPDRLKADVRVRLPRPSDIAGDDRAGATAPGTGERDPAPALAFDRRYVFVDPSQSLSELVPRLYPEYRARWDAIIEAIIERNTERLAGTDSGTVIERGTRLQIPDIRRRVPEPAGAAEPEDERPEPGPAVAAVVRVEGEVEATDSAGRTRALDRGDAVRRHDTVITGPDASAKLRFDDGEQLFLRPDSRVRVREWTLPETGPGRRVVELVRGGLRAITGAIGNRSEDTYRTVTPQTTLGIRGTAYALRICGEGECPRGDDAGGSLEPGLYVSVDAGRVSLLNETGETEVGAGERRYVAGPASAPSAAAPAARGALYTQAEIDAGAGAQGEGADAEAAEEDDSPGWGWALIGLILLGAAL